MTKQAERFVINRIKELPSIQPKTGRWIACDLLDMYYACSECGFTVSNGIVSPLKQHKFCQNCGAKMEDNNG